MSKRDRIAMADLGYHNLLLDCGFWKREAKRFAAERDAWAAKVEMLESRIRTLEGKG